MEGEIINKVANSSLKVFDLEDYYPTNKRIAIDIAQWLFHGLVVKEKEFRFSLDQKDWSEYCDAYVTLYCSTDAILPQWAFMLVSSHLKSVAKDVFIGTPEQMEAFIYQDVLAKIDFTEYQDLPVIIKGCSKQPIPEQAYVTATQYMMNYARSIMFGEACSAVPIYKRKVKK